MELAVDLHIHSALSPCADNDMTPNNIINMALLKGLDIISVTDHNNASNLPAIHQVAVDKGMMLLPGIEVQTKEEVHILCYFKNAASAVEFGEMVYSRLPDVRIDEKIFGEQLVLDSEDNIIGKLDKLLLSSTDITIDQLFGLAKDFNGICIPAHVDRPSCSIISNLGFIPGNLGIKTVEISKGKTLSSILSNYPYLKNYRVIKSSDAHYLYDICERENFIDPDEYTLTDIFKYLLG